MLDLIGRARALTVPNLSPITSGDLGTIIANILSWLLYFAGVLAVGYLIYGGVLYITAGGDAEKATKGRTAVINAIIGIVIILLALLIVTWVTNAVKGGSGIDI